MPTTANNPIVDPKANKAHRHELTNTLMGFMALCLPHYMTLPSGEFHYDLAQYLQDPEEEQLCIIGFRGSGKTTFSSLAYPLFCALNERYRFIILINDTYQQAKVNMQNIKYEIEHNKHIAREYPGIGIGDNWSKADLVLNNGVRILGRSRGQKVRGMRHREHRPDLVLIDDPEDLDATKTKTKRDDTERWFNSEIIPAIKESDSKLIMIGNLLHKDALMSRVARRDLFKTVKIPLIGEDGEPTWKAKYPNNEAIEKQRQRVDSRVAWSREYLLKIISSDEQIVKEEDIHYYDNSLLEKKLHGQVMYPPQAGTSSVDLAISEKETADLTAIVQGIRVTYEDENKIWIKPNITNRRMDFNTTQQVIKQKHKMMPMGSDLIVEDVAYQRSAIQELERKGLPVKGIRPVKDKRARLETVASYIKSGRIMFPKKGADELIEQLLGFGIEEHDDMVDALVYLIMHMVDVQQGAMGGRVDTV